MIGQQRDAVVERNSFTFQEQRPVQLKRWARWRWIPLAVVGGVAVVAFVVGHASPHHNPFSGSELPPGPPAGEIQVADRSLGDGWSLRAFDNAPAGPLSRPQIAYELVEDSAGVTVKRGPFSFGTTPHFSVPGLALVRGDPDGEGSGWRWTTFYEVIDPSITAVRVVFAGQVVDAMRPVKLDDIRFVVLSADQDAARTHVEGVSRRGRVLASSPLADPTFGRAIP